MTLTVIDKVPSSMTDTNKIQKNKPTFAIQHFPGDSYDTPDNTPRFLMDRMFLGSRWFFVAGYLGFILRFRFPALKNNYDTAAWSESSYGTFRLTERCGGRFHLRGLDNMRSCEEPVVFISNHMSTLETFVLPCIIAPFMDVTFVVKESLVSHPLFGPIMRSRNPVVVKRVNPREDFRVVMEKGREFLAKGVSIVVFPQSTRTEIFNTEEFNTLGVKLAKSAGVKVIPIALKTDFWGNGKYLKEVGPINRDKPIHMVFGKPIEITGSGKEEHRQIVEFIKTNLREWGVTII
jgi:1-acyl-sn-glycerol-3-phosphate acyltransferase